MCLFAIFKRICVDASAPYRRTIDMWVRAVWWENKRETEGVIPNNWIIDDYVFWPPGSDATKPMHERHQPNSKWRMFNLVKVKTRSDCFETCDKFDETTAVEASSEDEEEVVPRRKQKKKKFDDFVTDGLENGLPTPPAKVVLGLPKPPTKVALTPPAKDGPTLPAKVVTEPPVTGSPSECQSPGSVNDDQLVSFTLLNSKDSSTKKDSASNFSSRSRDQSGSSPHMSPSVGINTHGRQKSSTQVSQSNTVILGRHISRSPHRSNSRSRQKDRSFSKRCSTPNDSRDHANNLRANGSNSKSKEYRSNHDNVHSRDSLSSQRPVRSRSRSIEYTYIYNKPRSLSRPRTFRSGSRCRESRSRSPLRGISSNSRLSGSQSFRARSRSKSSDCRYRYRRSGIRDLDQNTPLRPKSKSPCTTNDSSYPMTEARFQKRVIYLLTEIRNAVSRGHVREAAPASVDTIFIVDNLEDLTTMEEQLKSPEKRHELIQILSMIGGTSLRDNLKRMLLKVMTMKVLSLFNMCGNQKGQGDRKLAFKKTALYSVMKGMFIH